MRESYFNCCSWLGDVFLYQSILVSKYHVCGTSASLFSWVRICVLELYSFLVFGNVLYGGRCVHVPAGMKCIAHRHIINPTFLSSCMKNGTGEKEKCSRGRDPSCAGFWSCGAGRSGTLFDLRWVKLCSIWGSWSAFGSAFVLAVLRCDAITFFLSFERRRDV